MRQRFGVTATGRRWLTTSLEVTILGVATVFGGACDVTSESPDGSKAYSRDTLPDGTIVSRTVRAGGAEALALFEARAVGGGGSTGVEFGSIAALAVDDLGRVYALDRLVKSVRVYDSSGHSVRTFGRPGDGPGELGNPIGIAFSPAGDLWVVDVTRGRYVVYDTAGALVAEWPRQIVGWGWPWDGGFMADGKFCDPGIVQAADGDVVEAMFCHEVADDDLVAVDTLPLPAAEPTMLMVQGPNGRYAIMIPHARRRESRVAGGRLWAGFTDDYRLTARSPDGTRRIIEHVRPPVRITPQERSFILDSLTELGVKRAVAAEELGDERQVFETFVVGISGRLWVLRGSFRGGTEIDVFDREGFLVSTGTADFDVRPRPVVTGEAIWAVRTDELDVPRLVRLEVRR